jgi:hypothetical protein
LVSEDDKPKAIIYLSGSYMYLLYNHVTIYYINMNPSDIIACDVHISWFAETFHFIILGVHLEFKACIHIPRIIKGLKNQLDIINAVKVLQNKIGYYYRYPVILDIFAKGYKTRCVRETQINAP